MLTAATECPNPDSRPHDAQSTETPLRSKEQIKILLTGGSRLLQESVIHLLDGSRFAVHSCADDIDQAIGLAAEQPDAFDLLIVQLFGNSEIGFFGKLAQLKQLAERRRVVLLAWPVKDLSFVASSVDAGVDAYLESNISQDGFQRSLDLVVSGNQIFPSRVAPVPQPFAPVGPQHPDTGSRTTAAPVAGAHLSGRETEILRHLANGEPNKVIANDLHITEATVKVHVKGILRKIGAANRTQAAIWAIHNGLNPVFPVNGDTPH